MEFFGCESPIPLSTIGKQEFNISPGQQKDGPVTWFLFKSGMGFSIEVFFLSVETSKFDII